MGSQISPDRKYLLTWSDDNTAKVTNLITGEERVIGHTGGVISAQFSPDSKFVVTASNDNTARVVDLSGSGPESERVIRHTESVRAAQFSPNSKFVVTASMDDTAKVVDLSRSGPDSERLIQHGYPVLSAQFSSGRKFFFTSAGNEVHFFDLKGDIVDDSRFNEALTEYDQMARLRGSERELTMREQFIYLKLLFEKAKSTGRMNRDQALKLMTSNVSTAELRGYGLDGRPPEERHVLGVIDLVFPPATAVPAAPASPANTPAPTTPGAGR